MQSLYKEARRLLRRFSSLIICLPNSDSGQHQKQFYLDLMESFPSNDATILSCHDSDNLQKIHEFN